MNPTPLSVGNSLVEALKKNWKSFIIVIFLGILGGIGYFYFPSLPQIGNLLTKNTTGGTEELPEESGKIPYTTKVLSIQLDTPIAPASINTKTVSLSPHIDGTTSVSSDGKTVSYTLSKTLDIGEIYDLTVASSVQKSDGTPLGKDTIRTFLAVPGAQAVKIFPTGTLDTLSQTITVVFNTPIIALTNLDERDKLPCPLSITPKIEGKCVWTNTSILEFTPTKPLEGSSRYRLEVANTSIPGLLHTLEKTLTGEIMTTPLRVEVSNTFSPYDGISLSTNFPVGLDSLSGSIKLMQIPTGSGETSNFLIPNITPEKNEDGSLSETRFTIKAKDQPFTYNTAYSLEVGTTLKPKNGTEVLTKELKASLRTNTFANISAYQDVKNSSGSTADTRSYDIKGGFIPGENSFFLISFDQEVPLDPKFITIRKEKSTSSLDYSIIYGKMNTYDGKGNITGVVDNKKELKITPKSPFEKNTRYELLMSKSANTSLREDEIYRFETAPAFTISDFTLLSNTVACIYTNNKILGLTEYWGGTSETSLPTVSTLPTSKTPILRTDILQSTWSDDGKTYISKYTCPQNGKNAYIVDLRLNPSISYAVNFLPTLTDEYGQTLSKTGSYTVKTGPIDPKDRYLYSSTDGQTKVIPSNLPIVLGLLSVNADSTNIDVCEMDEAGYIQFLKDQRYQYAPSQCVKKISKKITLKNRYWTMTPTQVDIEKEVLSEQMSQPYIYISGYLDGADSNLSQSFAHTFIRSNLSLTLEDGKNRRVLFASSYDGKTIPSDLSFTTYRWNEGANNYEVVDKNSISYDASRKVYSVATGTLLDIIVAKNDTYYGIVNLSNDQTSNYDFKYISGQDASNTDYLYIYPDRPLYKPGETVYFKGVLRNFHFDGYYPSAGKKGKLKIIGGEGSIGGETTIADMDVSIDANSNIHGEFILPKTAPLGRYRFEFGFPDKDGYYASSVYNNGEFFIEAYKKPVFKVIIETPKPDTMIGESVDIPGKAEYYFGGALGGAEYQYSILSQKYYFNPQSYSNYTFSQNSNGMDCLYWGYCQYQDTMITSGTGKLDTKGSTIMHHDYTKGATSGEEIYTYSLEVTDPDTKKTVNQSVSQIIHATDGYVGIMAPYWNSGKNGIKLSGVVLDYSAKALPSKTVGLELIKREWKTVKKEGVDGVFYNDGVLEEKVISTDTTTSDTLGEFAYNFSGVKGGEYEIRATYTGSNAVGFVSSVYAYVSGENENSWYEGNNTVADMTADATILSVGDRAGFTLKTPIEQGKMLVTIEKDDGILDAYVQDITGTTTRIEFPIRDTYIPNVYVKVFALGQNQGEKLPIYKRALSVVKVLPDPKKLTVTVTTEKSKYLPGELVKITINVKDKDGKSLSGANGSLSVVDESLLALAGNPMKNPFAFFYDMKRYLGVMTYTSLLNLVEKLEVKDTSLGEKGGAGEGQKGGLSKKKRGAFKDTAYWQADFTTDQNGNVTITTPALPDNLTTWVIEAVINTKKSQVGVGTTHIQTSKSVLINDNLPRFLGTSDKVELAPVVFNKTGKDSIFDINMVATNVTIENPKQSIEMKAGEQKAIPFTMTVDSIEKLRERDPQASKITLQAVSRMTGEQDTVELTIPIIETTSREAVATSGRADPKTEERIDLKNDIRKNGGSLTLSYAATLLPGLLSGLDFLTTYPYGCIEQKLATIMPEVYLKALYQSVDVPYDLSKKMVKRYESKETGYTQVSVKDIINEILSTIPSYQRLDGGFVYWTNSPGPSSLPLTLSVVSRLEDIKNIGFVVPIDITQSATKYIKNEFYTNRRVYCMNNCEYTVTERLNMIRGVLSASPDDYEAYKMYQVLTTDTKKMPNGWDMTDSKEIYKHGTDFSLGYGKLLIQLSTLKGVSEKEKNRMLSEAKELVNRIGNESIVMNPRGAFIGRGESNPRLTNTLSYVELLTSIGGETLSMNRTALDQMTRWIISQKKKDGSWGSTLDTTSVIRAITSIEKATGDIRNTSLESLISLNGNVLEKKTIDATNRLETFSTGFTLSNLGDVSQFGFTKTGTGKIYYDISLTYNLKASTLLARDEGFFLESTYYDYAEYREIEKAQQDEWLRYMNGEVLYTELKYPKDIPSYLTPLSSFEVGKLVIAYNRMIIPEPRDQVAFEGFIPAGSELVNPNLKTESQDVINSTTENPLQNPNYSGNENYSILPRKTMNTLFEHEEWQDDRYFGTVGRLDAGVYTFSYILRPTHGGVYELRPSRVGEFYAPEVFGRTNGRSITIKR